MTDSQLYMLIVAAETVIILAAWTAWQHYTRRRRRPPRTGPYDWARDTTYRQAVTVRRRAS